MNTKSSFSLSLALLMSFSVENGARDHLREGRCLGMDGRSLLKRECKSACSPEHQTDTPEMLRRPEDGDKTWLDEDIKERF